MNYNRDGLLVTGSEPTMASKFIVNNKCTDRQTEKEAQQQQHQ